MNNIISNFIYIIKRYQTSSVLNLLGLSASILIFLLIAIQVHYDLTFNASIKNNQDIFQLTKKQTTADDETYISHFSINEGNTLSDKFPEIRNSCYIISRGYNKEFIFVNAEGGKEREHLEFKTAATEGFKDVFKPEIVEGSIDEVFTTFGNTMISQSTAKRIFGKDSPIGKTVELGVMEVVTKKNEQGVVIGASTQYGYKPFTIQAVYKDFADNSSINNGFIYYQPAIKYFSYSEFYIEVGKDIAPKLAEKMNSKDILDQLNFMSLDVAGEHNLDIEKKNIIELIPIRNIQMNYPKISLKTQNKNNVYFLISIGLLALTIAYINFVNFSTAIAPTRVRSINIRLILGSSKTKIQLILAFETVLFTFCAFILALIFIKLIEYSNILNLFTASIDIAKHISLLLSICSILLTISFLIGLYPAYYTTSFNLIAALKTTGSTGIRSSGLRKVLTVIQLFIAICFITIALFVKQQHSFLANRTLGFDKNNILVLNTKSPKGTMLNTDIKTFVGEVMRNPILKTYTASSPLIGKAFAGKSSVTDETGKVFVFNTIVAADNFLDFFHIPVIEGKGIDGEQHGQGRKAVVNEQFTKRHHINNGLEGLLNESLIKTMPTIDFVGVMKDFNYQPLLDEIGSLAIIASNLDNLDFIYFRPSEGNTNEARMHIEETWKKFSDMDIKLNFLDEQLEQSYQDQEKLSNAVSIVSIIIILIAIIGVYGLITFQTKTRTKEIAIRKVNGASIKDILFILNEGLLYQFIIACVMAIPTAYFTTELWLKHFPYRIDLNISTFILGALVVAIITTITISTQSYKAANLNPSKTLKSE